MRYKCPGTYISSQYDTLAHSLGSWNYLWNVSDPTQIAQGLGVPHTVEVNAIFGCASVNGGCPASYNPGGSNAAIVGVVQGYWTSFIRCVIFVPSRVMIWGQTCVVSSDEDMMKQRSGEC
jgi:cholinesterase